MSDRKRRDRHDATRPVGHEDSRLADRGPDGLAMRAGWDGHAFCQRVAAAALLLPSFTAMAALHASPLFTATRTLQSIARGMSPFTAFPPRELPR